MSHDLTKGRVVKSMVLFAIPMILGDLLQHCYRKTLCSPDKKQSKNSFTMFFISKKLSDIPEYSTPVTLFRRKKCDV